MIAVSLFFCKLFVIYDLRLRFSVYFTNLIIHFTLVGGRVLGSNVSVGQCLTENQLFDESVEDLAYVAGLSTVEAKGEFVEVALEMHVYLTFPW